MAASDCVDEKALEHLIFELQSEGFVTSIEFQPNVGGNGGWVYAREGRRYRTLRLDKDGDVRSQTNEELSLPEPLFKASCCHRHAACFREGEKGICVYCAPRFSIFRLPAQRKDRAIQAAADEALAAQGVKLDGIDNPQTWEGESD